MWAVMMKTSVLPKDDHVSSPSRARHHTSPEVHATKQIEKGRKRAKSSQIAPKGPTIKNLDAASRRINYDQIQGRGFSQAFGVLGFPMLLVLIVCVCWTIWLVFVALEPNVAANWLMNTAAYDKGRFWLISDADPAIALAGAVELIVVALCYFVVLLRMLLYREKLAFSSFHGESSTWLVPVQGTLLRILGPNFSRGETLWNDLTSFEGKNRKRWNALLKMFDLGMETIMLHQLLQNGSPAALTYGFAVFVAVNALSCVVNVLSDRFSAMTEVLIDSIFDLSCAVLFPIITLVYCYKEFDFDREVYLTYLEKLPPGSYEHLARTFADPSEIALFRVNFDSLRISSVLDFMVRISMNLTFCYRFERVLEALVWARHRQVTGNNAPASQNRVPKTLTVVFVTFSLSVLLVTHKAIADSTALCSAHPECVVFAHRWKTSDNICPCIVLIDIDLAPKTYDEWTYPVDAYDKVKALASSGMLTSLQVVNRQLREWPEELRGCHNLKAIQLVYTDISILPTWIKELKRLETVQIEGRFGSQNLVELPDDIFNVLPRLSLVHLGIHQNLLRIPPLTGVPQLQSLFLAWIPMLHELPDFDQVPKLSRLVLTLLPRLEQLPDLTPLQNLVELVVYRPSHICCNGFTGSCNLTHPSCQANGLLQTSTATCLLNTTDPSMAATPFLESSATAKAFKKFESSICQESPFDRIDVLTFPTRESIEMCGGKPFRQCHFPGNITGICYNTRFQVLSCLVDANYIALRRLQIERGVGPKCDPTEEMWLGCSA